MKAIRLIAFLLLSLSNLTFAQSGKRPPDFIGVLWGASPDEVNRVMATKPDSKPDPGDTRVGRIAYAGGSPIRLSGFFLLSSLPTSFTVEPSASRPFQMSRSSSEMFASNWPRNTACQIHPGAREGFHKVPPLFRVVRWWLILCVLLHAARET